MTKVVAWFLFVLGLALGAIALYQAIFESFDPAIGFALGAILLHIGVLHLLWPALRSKLKE